MTLLTVVKDVCAQVGVLQPTSVFAGIANNRTMQEMVSLANEVAQGIAYDQREWQRLKKNQVYNGDGVKTAFDLPQNYKRMLLSTNVWRSTSSQTPMRFIPDTDEWMSRRANNDASAWGEWTLLGGQMQIYPAMGVGVSARFAYLDKNCVLLSSGGTGDVFMADGDSFILDERLLKLGMIWQWKAKKGSPYAEDMGTFNDALAVAMGSNSPAPIIIGTMPISANAKVAYPWPVPT